MNLSVGNAVVQKEENIAIKGYVIRKTLELLFFSSHFSFSLKKQKNRTNKNPEAKTLLGVVTNILGIREGTL